MVCRILVHCGCTAVSAVVENCALLKPLNLTLTETLVETVSHVSHKTDPLTIRARLHVADMCASTVALGDLPSEFLEDMVCIHPLFLADRTPLNVLLSHRSAQRLLDNKSQREVESDIDP